MLLQALLRHEEFSEAASLPSPLIHSPDISALGLYCFPGFYSGKGTNRERYFLLSNIHNPFCQAPAHVRVRRLGGPFSGTHTIYSSFTFLLSFLHSRPGNIYCICGVQNLSHASIVSPFHVLFIHCSLLASS